MAVIGKTPQGAPYTDRIWFAMRVTILFRIVCHFRTVIRRSKAFVELEDQCELNLPSDIRGIENTKNRARGESGKRHTRLNAITCKGQCCRRVDVVDAIEQISKLNLQVGADDVFSVSNLRFVKQHARQREIKLET